MAGPARHCYASKNLKYIKMYFAHCFDGSQSQKIEEKLTLSTNYSETTNSMMTACFWISWGCTLNKSYPASLCTLDQGTTKIKF